MPARQFAIGAKGTSCQMSAARKKYSPIVTCINFSSGCWSDRASNTGLIILLQVQIKIYAREMLQHTIICSLCLGICVYITCKMYIAA